MNQAQNVGLEDLAQKYAPVVASACIGGLGMVTVVILGATGVIGATATGVALIATGAFSSLGILCSGDRSISSKISSLVIANIFTGVFGGLLIGGVISVSTFTIVYFSFVGAVFACSSSSSLSAGILGMIGQD